MSDLPKSNISFGEVISKISLSCKKETLKKISLQGFQIKFGVLPT
jgi:hypothetical protein